MTTIDIDQDFVVSRVVKAPRERVWKTTARRINSHNGGARREHPSVS
jgi:hypothetical protein